MTAEDRFWSSIVVVENCWQWTGRTNGKCYGTFSDGGKRFMAHRWAYEHLRGPIPSGLTLDHLCRNRGCVNPNHLEPVTLRENILRGTSPAANQARQTHCIHGHEFTPDNTYISGRGQRSCKQCHKRWAKKYRSPEYKRMRGSSVVLGKCPDDASPTCGLPGSLGAAHLPEPKDGR